MSRFEQSCDYYLRVWSMQSQSDKQEIARRCRAKYPKGINLVIVSYDLVGLFTPNATLDLGRIFLTCERLENEVFEVGAIPPQLMEDIKQLVDSYDPMTTILWLFVLTETENSEFQLFSTKV